MMIVSLNAFFNDFSYLHFYLECKVLSDSHEFDPIWKIGDKNLQFDKVIINCGKVRSICVIS